MNYLRQQLTQQRVADTLALKAKQDKECLEAIKATDQLIAEGVDPEKAERALNKLLRKIQGLKE